MIYKTFEEYLESRCFEENPTVLDDDMSDFFDSWLGDQNVEAIMIYADGWMRETKSAIATEVRHLFN
jgi:hypothetical protein